MPHCKEKIGAFRSWAAMMRRCYNPLAAHYERYGGSGIIVCKRWLKFKNFLVDMGRRPEGMVLDRKNNQHGYSLANCKWSTRKESTANRSCTVWVTIKGKRMRVDEAAAKFGVLPSIIYHRLERKWPMDDLIKPPLRHGFQLNGQAINPHRNHMESLRRK